MPTIRPNSPKAWLLAARPKTLSGALAPVVIATALSLSPSAQGGSGASPAAFWTVAALCLTFAALMQVAANFINDYFDFRRGTDAADRLGPERACQQGWVTPRAMLLAIGLALTLAALAGLGLLAAASQTQDINTPALMGMGAACIAFAFLYTTLLSYCGGGDLLVWVFFGLVPVAGTYYVLTGTLSREAWLLAAAMGLVTDTLLVVNNYRDRASDRRAGKRTLVVALGERFGEQFYLWQGLAGTALAALAVPASSLWLYLIYIVGHALNYRAMRRIHSGRGLNALIGRTSLAMLAFTLLTAAALLA